MKAYGFDWTAFLGQHRSIAIHIPILEWTKDYHATALFEELVWRWNAAGRETFTATDADLMAKLYLTRGNLRGARARLVELGVLETVKRGMPPVLHYTLNLEVAQAALESTLVQNSPNVGRKSTQRRAKIASTSISECIQSKDQSNQDSPNLGRNANDASAEAASLPADSAPRDEDPKAKKPRAGRKPKAESLPNPLAEMIAQDLTGRSTIQNRDRGLLWPIHDDIRGLVGEDPVPGVMVWLSFREALEAGGKWAGVKPYNARNEFGRWAANGGAPTIAQIVAEFGGRAA